VWFNHHSAVGDLRFRQRPPFEFIYAARETGMVTTVEPPTTTAIIGTAARFLLVVVLVVCRKFHPVVVVFAKVTVTLIVASILQRVAGVSAVSRHFQSIFVVKLVTDLERPVLSRVPEIC